MRRYQSSGMRNLLFLQPNQLVTSRKLTRCPVCSRSTKHGNQMVIGWRDCMGARRTGETTSSYQLSNAMGGLRRLDLFVSTRSSISFDGRSKAIMYHNETYSKMSFGQSRFYGLPGVDNALSLVRQNPDLKTWAYVWMTIGVISGNFGLGLSAVS